MRSRKKAKEDSASVIRDTRMSLEMPRSQGIALKDDPSFDSRDELSPQAFSPSPSSSKVEDLEALPPSPITETSPRHGSRFKPIP